MDLPTTPVVRPSDNAVARAYDEHGRMVYNVCLRMLGSAAPAEDATQVVFVLLLKKYGDKLPPYPAGWLYNTAVFVCRESRRAALRRFTHEQEATQMHAQPTVDETESAWADVAPHLDDAIASLPAAYREPIVMVYLHNTEQTAVAKSLKIPDGTLRWRLSHGLSILREKLEKHRRKLSAALLLALLSRCGEASASVGCESAICSLTPRDFSRLTPAARSLLSRCQSRAAYVPYLLIASVLLMGALTYTAASVLSSTGTALKRGATAASTERDAEGRLLTEQQRGDGAQPVAVVNNAPPGAGVDSAPAIGDDAAAFSEEARARNTDQVPMPQGGTVVLLSRVAYGDYERGSFAFHLGLRNDDRRVSNEVNLIFGNVRRPGDKVDSEARSRGRNGAAGVDGGSRDGRPPQDEFRVVTRAGSNRILDLGAVDYEAVRQIPAGIHDADYRVSVQRNHVYVLKIFEKKNKPPGEPLYVKLKVTRHRQNDAVEFVWQPLVESLIQTPDF